MTSFLIENSTYCEEKANKDGPLDENSFQWSKWSNTIPATNCPKKKKKKIRDCNNLVKTDTTK